MNDANNLNNNAGSNQISQTNNIPLQDTNLSNTNPQNIAQSQEIVQPQVVAQPQNIEQSQVVAQPQVTVTQQQTIVQPQNNQVTQPMNNTNINQVPLTPQNDAIKQNKKKPIGLIIGGVVGVIAIIVALLLIFGFGNKGSITLSGPKGIVKNYVENLISKEYSENFSLISLPENHFLIVSDYVEYVNKKSDYQDLDNFKVSEIIELSNDEKIGLYNVTLKNENEVIKSLNLKIENVNGWKVVEDNFFIKNWSIIVPKDTKVLINDKEVPQSLVVANTSLTNEIKYTIPAITSTKKKIVLNNKLGSKEIEETPLIANNNLKIVLELNNQELVDKAYEYVKNTWNNVYTSYIAKENVSDVANKYFDSSVDINDVNVFYNDSFKVLTEKKYGWENSDYSIVEVINGENQNYILTSELIQLNFGYKLVWTSTYKPFTPNRYEMTRYSKIILKYDGNSFKIYDVQDTKLFSHANQFTKDY